MVIKVGLVLFPLVGYCSLSEGIVVWLSDNAQYLSVRFENNLPESKWSDATVYLADPKGALFDVINLLNRNSNRIQKLNKSILIVIDNEEKNIETTVTSSKNGKEEIVRARKKFSSNSMEMLRSQVCSALSIANCFGDAVSQPQIMLYTPVDNEMLIASRSVGLITFGAIPTDERRCLVFPPTEHKEPYKKIIIKREEMEKYFRKIEAVEKN